ncbi:MAG: hypothetical protein FWC61_03270 [Proteobacteria bacterium]|nr:hypothetical protein [Pseudomonadota bacterium]
MRKLILTSVMAMATFGAFAAADMTIYYSPTCPHCHHARDFTSQYLVYEYPTLKVTNVDVTNQANYPAFQKVIKDCGYDSGGVPIVVINGKCFQGFGTPETTGNEFRGTLDAGLTADEKATAAANRAEMAANPDQYRSRHADRLNAITEQAGQPEKKTENSGLVFWAVLGVLVVALGFVLLRKKKS